MLYCARAFCYNGRARTVVMDINATASRKTPRSMRLASALKDSILRGKWKPGDVLPSIREIAAMAGTSVKVSRRALDILSAEGWTRPRRGIGSEVVDRGAAPHEKGRVLIYMRETGYSYYCGVFLSTFERRLRTAGYGVVPIHAAGRSEASAVRHLAAALEEHWSLVILMGGGSEPRSLVAEAGYPFVLIGDGAPLRVPQALLNSSFVGRLEIRSDRALPAFLRECVRRKVSSVVQFKYAEGAFDVAFMLTHAGIAVDTVTIPRTSSPKEVSRASMAMMRRIVARRELPDLVLFTDDCIAQGALIELAASGVAIPGDVMVVTHANKGSGPVWTKPLSRLEMDATSHARTIASAVIDYLRKGVFPSDLEIGSVWKAGATF